MRQTLALLDSRKSVIERIIPGTLRGQLTFEAVKSAVALEMQRNDRLAKCSPASIYSSVLYLLRMGLEIGGAAQQAYLVPFKGECTPMVGAQGKIEMAMRSGQIAGLVVQAIHEHDDVVLDFLSPEHNRHRPALRDRGEVICVYAQITLKNGVKLLEIMSAQDFEQIRDAASRRNGGRLSPAYKEWPVEMWRRSCLNRALKRAPKSADLLEVLATQSKLEDGGRLVARKSGVVDVIDAEPEPEEDVLGLADEPAALPDHGEVDEPEPDAPEPERVPARRQAAHDAMPPSPPDDGDLFGSMP